MRSMIPWMWRRQRQIPATLPNIIFVQLETFIDPYELNFLQYSEDPIPNFRSLMENYSSGYMTVSGCGSGNRKYRV